MVLATIYPGARSEDQGSIETVAGPEAWVSSPPTTGGHLTNRGKHRLRADGSALSRGSSWKFAFVHPSTDESRAIPPTTSTAFFFLFSFLFCRTVASRLSLFFVAYFAVKLHGSHGIDT
ncbi:hypothetical protein CGRA01v4_03469 [Colletotrichum graminicola]|nr:hypothetical protein CGRA01v4_03469 [Colletotrichum graminicola]